MTMMATAAAGMDEGFAISKLVRLSLSLFVVSLFLFPMSDVSHFPSFAQRRVSVQQVSAI